MSSASLRIAVLGAGRIGSAFAFQLARAGRHRVTVVARPGSLRLQQLERDGGIIDGNGQLAAVEVASGRDPETAFDLVVVTVLAHQAVALLPLLQRSAATCIQFMSNNFDPEQMQNAIGVERCGLGMPFIQATLDGDGRLGVKIGAGGQKSIMDRQRWVDLFNAAGLPAALEPEMGRWLRCHTPVCVAFESVSVAGSRRGGGASWGEAARLARGVQAGFRLIAAMGSGVYPASKRRIAAAPVGLIAATLWGMSRIPSFRTLLATGEAECGALVDAMVEVAVARQFDGVAAISAMKPEERRLAPERVTA